jgi:hypothetical protein
MLRSVHYLEPDGGELIRGLEVGSDSKSIATCDVDVPAEAAVEGL